jgi:hypothetical protein
MRCDVTPRASSSPAATTCFRQQQRRPLTLSGLPAAHGIVEAAVPVVIVTAIGEHDVGSAPWSAALGQSGRKKCSYQYTAIDDCRGRGRRLRPRPLSVSRG